MRLAKYDETGGVVEVHELFMDGYPVGDRLLEGVPFKLTIKDGKLQAECVNKYTRGIDWAYWEKECAQYALEAGDVFSTTKELNDDDGFIKGVSR